jgi:camphor 5-monooxygenase
MEGKNNIHAEKPDDLSFIDCLAPIVFEQVLAANTGGSRRVNMAEAQLAPRPDNVPADRVIDFNLHMPVPAGQTVHEFWRAAMARASHDVMWTPHNGGHWMVMDPDLCETVLTDSERFSSRIVIVPRDPAGEAYSKYIPLSLDPPKHGPYRKLLNEGLSPKAINARKDAMRALTVELIEGFRAKGRCNFSHDFAEQLPIRIFLQMVDLPVSDAQRLKYLADQFTRPDGSITFDEVEKGFSDYIGPVIRNRRGGPGDDLITQMVSGQVEGRDLTHEEAENLCTQALVGGLDTVVNLLGFVFSHLAQDGETRCALAADSGKLDDAILEFLRRFPVVSDSREVIGDTEFGGVTLLKRDMIMASTIAIALSDKSNPDPMEFRLGRQARRQYIFGKGSHTCPGAHLARAELKLVLEEWLARIPDFRLAEGSALTFTSGIVATVDPFELEWDV